MTDRRSTEKAALLFLSIRCWKRVTMNQKKLDAMHCPLQVTLALIGGKYKTAVLFHLMEGEKHFSQIHQCIPEASNKVLAQQLREMTDDGLIEKKTYQTVPLTTVYALTDYGKTLCPIIEMMYRWGEIVFETQNKKWDCETSDISAWMKENGIPPENTEEIIRRANTKRSG